MTTVANKNIEIEIKILNVDVPQVEANLKKNNARCIFAGLQRLFVYDFYPINSTYHAILWTINRSVSQKEKKLSYRKMGKLLNELDDLLTDSDRKVVNDIYGDGGICELASKVIQMGDKEFTALNNNKFISIIDKYSTNPNKWARLRADDQNITLSVKHILGRKTIGNTRTHSIDSVKEIEISVGDFDVAKLLLEELGFFYKNYQEKKRSSYLLENGVRVDIDQWPLIPPYLEIEGDDQTSIYKVVEMLGYDETDVKIMNTDDVYALYNINMYDYSELTFAPTSHIE